MMCRQSESHDIEIVSNPENNSFSTNSIWYQRGIRLLMILAGLIVWFGTQALLSSRSDPGSKIDDVLHIHTTAINGFLHENPSWSTILLIVSSMIVDLSGFFLVASSLFHPTLRPFLTLLILFVTRQICQALIALPAPERMIWYDPGFPSFFVTYDVTNDFFFSGHTGITMIAAVEGFRANSGIGKLLGVFFVGMQISIIIVLRAHYTMDIFAGVVVALLASIIANWAVNNRKSNENSKAMEKNKLKQV